MKQLPLYLLFLFFGISCTDREQDEDTSIYIPDDLPEMKIARNHAWEGDVVLHIYRTEKRANGATFYSILSEYQNKPVGFYLEVNKVIDPKQAVPGGITFLSMGDTSNNFLKVLAAVYHVKQDSLGFVFADTVRASYSSDPVSVTISGPGNDNPGTSIAKLFFETASDTSQLLLKIFEQHGTISLSEKDSTYRRAIIRALSKQ